MAATDTTTSTDAMTTTEAQDWLDRHGMETELIGGQVWVANVWTQNGQVLYEWVKVTCKLSWLRNWMNY